MHFIIKLTIAFALSAIGVGVSQIPLPQPDMSSTTPTDKPYEALGGFGQAMADIYRYVPSTTTTTLPAPVYKHGDCSWLPAVALQAGWAAEQIPQLTKYALRESGCCPARIGGDTVDKNCKVTGVAEWSHRSDSGLMQINGVHWLQEHSQYDGLICKQMGICTQEPLLDALTNLRAARLIFSRVGWSAWDMCNRNKTCK
jgi:hypothetical protein